MALSLIESPKAGHPTGVTVRKLSSKYGAACNFRGSDMVLCELAHTLLMSYFLRVRAQPQMASTAIPLVIFICVLPLHRACKRRPHELLSIAKRYDVCFVCARAAPASPAAATSGGSGCEATPDAAAPAAKEPEPEEEEEDMGFDLFD